MNDPATIAHQVRGLLVETLNQYAPLEPHLTKDFGEPIRYRGTVVGYGVAIHTFIFDGDPPFDVWAFENDSGEILQVAWNADGYIDLSRPDPS
jgi:hypothetical protein